MHTRRRILVSLAGAGCLAAAPTLAQTGKTLRLGAIAVGPPMAPDAPPGKILIGALADLGYAPGRNLTFAARGAMTDLAKLPGLIEELKKEGAQIFGRPGLSERRRRQGRRRSHRHLRGGRRSRRDRPGRELGPSRRRRYRHFGRCGDPDRQAARAAESLCAGAEAGRDALEFGRSRNDAALSGLRRDGAIAGSRSSSRSASASPTISTGPSRRWSETSPTRS